MVAKLLRRQVERDLEVKIRKNGDTYANPQRKTIRDTMKSIVPGQVIMLKNSGRFLCSRFLFVLVFVTQ